jgi:hypothetical protein
VGDLLTCEGVSGSKDEEYDNTYNLPFGRILYGMWCSNTTGVYFSAVVTNLLYTITSTRM